MCGKLHYHHTENVIRRYSFKTTIQRKRKTVFNQRLICKKILNMLGSYGDLGDCGKISASTVFETITDITLLKYLKSLVTCHSLFKQTSKKENPSSCFTSAPLKNPNACNSFQDTVSVVLSDFEFHSPSALLHLVYCYLVWRLFVRYSK